MVESVAWIKIMQGLLMPPLADCHEAELNLERVPQGDGSVDKLLHGMTRTNKLWDTVVESSPDRRGSTDKFV